jgi:hypothetical protein
MSADARGDDAAALVERDRLILRLLAEAEAVCGPTAWPRVESLITALVDLYGVGLERIVAMARARVSDPASLDRALVGDEIVSSLLVLHEIVEPPPEDVIPVERLVRGAHP